MACFSYHGHHIDIMNCWKNFSKRFTIKVAISHLLLGAIAAAFSFSDISTLSARSGEANIVSIASVMVNIQEHQSDADIQSQLPSTIKHVPISIQMDSLSFLKYSEPSLIIRLTPNNGIRAGPSSLLSIA